MLPLSLAPMGELTHVKKVTGKDDVRNHLATLGFVEGAEVTVINEINGNMICNIKGTRIALDRNMAARIMV